MKRCHLLGYSHTEHLVTLAMLMQHTHSYILLLLLLPLSESLFHAVQTPPEEEREREKVHFAYRVIKGQTRFRHRRRTIDRLHFTRSASQQARLRDTRARRVVSPSRERERERNTCRRFSDVYNLVMERWCCAMLHEGGR